MTRRLKVLELFAGTRSVSKAFEEHGHDTYTVELDHKHPNIDLYADVGQLQADTIREQFGEPDVVWASPPCTTYSVAGIHYHRRLGDKGYPEPISEFAKDSDVLVQHTKRLISDLDPEYFYIENPRGALRKMPFMQDMPRYTITYCGYGDFRQKPTDIWTDHPDPRFKPPCKPGSPCHVAAPRGSRTGTQGLPDAKERSRIPPGFCEHIVEISEEPKDMERPRRLYSDVPKVRSIASFQRKPRKWGLFGWRKRR